MQAQKKDWSVIFLIVVVLVILGASYFDRKDAEDQATDDEITRLQMEKMQPADHIE